MFKWTTLVLAGLACCLTLPALNAGTDMGCLPPPVTQDYLKKTVRVEIRGKLERVRIWLEGPRDPMFPMPNVGLFDSWQIAVGGKTCTLDLGINTDVEKGPLTRGFADDAEKLVGKTVLVTGTLNGDTIQVSGLKADGDYVKQTTEVEARGRLSGVYMRTVVLVKSDILVPAVAWNFVVDGKAYTLTFATPELEQLARALDGKAVVLTGTLDNDTITVKTLKAAQ